MARKKAQATTKPENDAKELASRSKQENGKAKEAEQEGEVENNNAAEEPEPEAEPEAEPETKEEADADAHTGQKRKGAPTAGTKTKSNKAPRQGSRTSSRTTGNPATPKQPLNFLLSAKSLEYCFPAEELEAANGVSSGKGKSKCYSLTSPSSFTPFEHLICAHLLAKPLSHVLGMRSIRTLLNEPFNFSTPDDIVQAGEKRVWEALEVARTQHRQKTATYMFGMAEAYADDETMFTLAEEANGDGPKGVIAHVKNTVPGLGNIGGEIFARRVQCVDGWGDALWPYADSKALEAVREIGIDVKDAEDLQNAIEGLIDWNLVGDLGLQEREVSKGQLVGEDMEMQVQTEYVVALERALGCVLEGKVAELRKAAASAFS